MNNAFYIRQVALTLNNLEDLTLSSFPIRSVLSLPRVALPVSIRQDAMKLSWRVSVAWEATSRERERERERDQSKREIKEIGRTRREIRLHVIKRVPDTRI